MAPQHVLRGCSGDASRTPFQRRRSVGADKQAGTGNRENPGRAETRRLFPRGGLPRLAPAVLCVQGRSTDRSLATKSHRSRRVPDGWRHRGGLARSGSGRDFLCHRGARLRRPAASVRLPPHRRMARTPGYVHESPRDGAGTHGKEQLMSDRDIFDELFVLEMANNHWGSVERGLKIVNTFAQVVRFNNVRAAIKLQLRDVDTFIHKDYVGRTDIRYIK